MLPGRKTNPGLARDDYKNGCTGVGNWCKCMTRKGLPAVNLYEWLTALRLKRTHRETGNEKQNAANATEKRTHEKLMRRKNDHTHSFIPPPQTVKRGGRRRCCCRIKNREREGERMDARQPRRRWISKAFQQLVVTFPRLRT